MFFVLFHVFLCSVDLAWPGLIFCKSIWLEHAFQCDRNRYKICSSAKWLQDLDCVLDQHVQDPAHHRKIHRMLENEIVATMTPSLKFACRLKKVIWFHFFSPNSGICYVCSCCKYAVYRVPLLRCNGKPVPNAAAIIVQWKRGERGCRCRAADDGLNWTAIRQNVTDFAGIFPHRYSCH